MNNNVLVSVVMSVYNCADYLDEAIESILNQTYTNFEFIIINDGSNDKSLNIIKKYMKKDIRIKLIDQKNKGLIKSLNKGIKKAKGKYIVRMDGDDISLSQRIMTQVEFMENNSDIGVCGTWGKVFGDNITTKNYKYPTNHDEIKTRLLFSVIAAHPSVIIRKSILDKHYIKYNEEFKNAEDYEYWTQLIKYTKFSNIPQILFKYRVLNNSVTRLANNEKSDLRYETLKSIFTKTLNKLNIINTEDENRLHFIISLNERMFNEQIDLDFLNKYLEKIISANKEVNYFNEKYLKIFLSKKFMIAVYSQLKQKNYCIFKIFNSKLFYYYIWSLINWQK